VCKHGASWTRTEGAASRGLVRMRQRLALTIARQRPSAWSSITSWGIRAASHTTGRSALYGGIRTGHTRLMLRVFVVVVSGGCLTSNARYTGCLRASVILIHSVGFTIHNTLHRLVSFKIVITTKTTHAGSSASTATGSFVVTRQSVASGEFAAAFGAYMWSFSSVQLGMALEIVETSESRLTGGANVRFFLAMSQQMALQIVVPGKFGCAIWTSVLFAGGRSCTLSCT